MPAASRSFRYGATRAWVERLRVVLADGRILDVGRGDAIDFDPGIVPAARMSPRTPRDTCSVPEWTGST